MATDIDPNKPLKSLNFSHLIGSPLLACISAQEKAALLSQSYIEEVGLKPGPDGLKEAVTVTFSFVYEGMMVDLKVPLLTIVPIPFFSIDTLEINFRASVKIDDGVISASYTAGSDSKGVESSAFNIESTVDVHVKASQDDMPSGLSKVLGFLGNNIRSYSSMLSFPEGADKELVKLICELTHSDVCYIHSDDSLDVDMLATKVKEAGAMTLSKMQIDHRKTDFRSLDALEILPGLTDLQLWYDTNKVSSLSLKAVPQLRSLSMKDITRNKKQSAEIDLTSLTNLRRIQLDNVRSFSEQGLNLSGNELLEEITLFQSPISELDISGCRNLRFISADKESVIGKLIVWKNFQLTDDFVGEFKNIVDR